MTKRFLILWIAFSSLLTTQCLLACSAAQQAAHACCPHKSAPERIADAAIQPAPVPPSLEVSGFLPVRVTAASQQAPVSRWQPSAHSPPPRLWSACPLVLRV